MTSDDNSSKIADAADKQATGGNSPSPTVAPVASEQHGPQALVVRSDVPAGLPYAEYRLQLRDDFFYSCAYCSMAEFEAAAVSFDIDHYEPRKARPDLENTYSNLMYSCSPCNQRKGDRSPPEEARARGVRFFRIDADIHNEHFELKGLLLHHKTPVGEYTNLTLDLNRAMLRRVRELRQRLSDCDVLIAEGVRGLRKVQFDQIPMGLRGRALQARNRAIALSDSAAEEIDAILKTAAKSPLLDDGPDRGERDKARKKRLKEFQTLVPGQWRAPRSQ